MSICFHIGYHKTGTTWMQRELFPRLAGLYLGKKYILKRKKEWHRVKHSFQDKNKDEIFNFIRQEQQSHGLNNLFFVSDETFLKTTLNIKEVSDKLCYEFPDAKILISIRKQEELFVSRFLHKNSNFSKYEYGKKIYNYFLNPDEKIEKKLASFYNFEKTYNLFLDKFPKNVHIIVYENLFSNTKEEISRLLDFCYTDHSDDNILNKINWTDIAQKKHNESLVKIGAKKEADLFGKYGIGADKLNLAKYNINSFFSESNKRLGLKLGLDLNKFGYSK